MNIPFLEPLNKDQDMSTENQTQAAIVAAKMTPERAAYEQALANTNRALIAAGEAAHKFAQGAGEIGIIVTIETVPMQPLEMGNYELSVTVRASRAVQQELQAMEEAALASERHAG